MTTEQKSPAQPDGNDQPYWGIFDAVSDGLIIQDLETQRVVEANTAAAAMHGYSREDFIGLHAAQYMRPESLRLFTEFSLLLTALAGAALFAAFRFTHSVFARPADLRR